jgi:hypothetical protein
LILFDLSKKKNEPIFKNKVLQDIPEVCSGTGSNIFFLTKKQLNVTTSRTKAKRCLKKRPVGYHACQFNTPNKMKKGDNNNNN